MMQCSRKLKVTDLNPHLICVLCGGYFVDATTIIECLHSFCRSCIVRYLETNKYCPICDVQVHKTRPLQNIRPDDTLQTIVYKLVPGLYQNEMRCRREFYAKHPEAKIQVLAPESRGELTDQSRIFLPDEPVSLCLEYIGPPNNNLSDQQGTWGRRYLRCPAAVSVSHLHKLIRAKFGLEMGHRVDVFYKEDILPNNWTLMDIAYIYQWKRKSPIHLSYQILESQRKRIKLSHDSVSSIESSSSEMETLPITGNSGNPLDNSKQASEAASATNTAPAPVDTTNVCSTSVPLENLAVLASAVATLSTEKPAVNESSSKSAVEWKEVQLQISENGIMSVAGVVNDRLLTPMQPISAPSQSDNAESIVKDTSIEKTNDTVDEKLSETKVPPVNSDPNLSALKDKKIDIIKSDSRTKPVDAQAKDVSDDLSKTENVKDVEAKAVLKEPANNHADSLTSSNKSDVGYKLPNNSDKTKAIFKSKTDKLEDTVRNIANRTEPSGKSDIPSKIPHVLTVSASKGGPRPKTSNAESTDSLAGTVHRPLTSAPKVYPGVKAPIYNSLPKEEPTKIKHNKSDSLNASGVKQTPMEILNTQNKLHNHMVKYKSHKASIKPWNPSISRAAALAMKHHAPQQSQSAASGKEANSSTENPPPVKQPRFFKIRNMPRFLGNPASGVKPMYQVAPGSEIVTGNAAVSPSTAVTLSSVSSATTTSILTTNCSNAHNVVTTVTSTISANSDTSSIVNNYPITTAVSTSSLPTTCIGVTYTTQKMCKQSGGPSLTLMKIDPKTLSPISVTPTAVTPHALNNPPRTPSSSQQKKLPPPFTPGSPKHSNHYTNCRTTYTNGSKNTVSRTPSPAHTGGLIPTHPFIPVSHANPHLLYGAFPNPFSAADSAGNRLLPGPTNSELIRAMSALCSSGSAFHPSLPPSISMLFNPHHAHHRPLPTERSNFKCSSNDKKSTQSPPPTVQRVPPSTKGFSETDSQHINLNVSNCIVEQPSNSLRLKKTKNEQPSSPTLPIKSCKQAQSNNAILPTSNPISCQSTKKILADNPNLELTQHQADTQSTSSNKVSIPNCTIPENKKPLCSNLPKLPGEKIQEISSELSVQNQKVENKIDNKSSSKGGTLSSKAINTTSVSDDKISINAGKLKPIDNEQIEPITVNNNNEVNNIIETKSKDEHLTSLNNNNNVNKITKASCVSAEDKSDVDYSIVNSKNA